MQNDRHIQAQECLDRAMQAAYVGNALQMNRSLAALDAATRPPLDPILVRIRAQGHILITGNMIVMSEHDRAAFEFQNVCDACLVLTSVDEQVQILIAAVVEFVIDVCPGISKSGNASVDNAGNFYVQILIYLLSECGLLSSGQEAGPDNQAVLSALASATSGFAESTRLVLAALAFCLGKVATNNQWTGQAMTAFIRSSKLLESVIRPSASSTKIALHLYGAMEFERQRLGDTEGAKKYKSMTFRYVPQADFAEKELAFLKRHGEVSREINESLGAYDRARATEIASNYLDSLSRDQQEFLSEDALSTLHMIAGRIVKGKYAKPAFHIAGPERNIVALNRLMAKADEGPTDAESVARFIFELLQYAFSSDRQVAWMASARLAKSFGGGDNPDTPQMALSILFGKMVARSLHGLRLELVQHEFWALTPYKDEVAKRQGQRLSERLVLSGRLGEALRYEALFESESNNAPIPRIADEQARTMALDDCCPLTSAERTLLKNVERMVLDDAPSPVQVFEALTVGATQLMAAHVATHQAFSVEPPSSSYEVVKLAIALHGDRYVATLSGQFGVQVKNLFVRPAELTQTAMEVLRMLHDSRTQVEPHDCTRRLYNMVFAPFEGTLRALNAQCIVVQASGALRRIPFGALYDGSDYLIRRFAFITHPGSSPFRDGDGLQRPLCAVSVVVAQAPGQDLLYTPLAEAESLHDALIRSGAGRVIDMIGHPERPATSESFERLSALRPSILHVSSHFDANPADVSRSAFILSDGSRYTLSQLAQLDLSSVSLAILLGCETHAVSEIADDSGLGALDTLLINMGVSSVIGTAWKVHDFYTHKMLHELLAQIFEKQNHLAMAVRNAVLSIATNAQSGKLEHPHHWGAFSLCGSWKGLNEEVTSTKQ